MESQFYNLKMILNLFLFLCVFHLGNSWTTEDLELFDLVESTSQNFYELLKVNEKASASDIRKAYRKLSTLLHPDKNKNENAEEEFRKVAAVADVLRNDEKRKQYDLILKTGLPDWRTPIYYYRRARNMRLYELAIFLFCLATFFQYIYAWTAYWERKYEIEEVLLSRIRKKAKHQRKGSNAKLEEEALMSEAVSQLQKPRCQDLFPVRLVFFVIHLIISFPSYIASCKNYFKVVNTPQTEEEEEEELQAPRVKSRKLVVKPEIPDYSNMPSYDVTFNNASMWSNAEQHNEIEVNVRNWQSDNLSEQQVLEFKKALKKFPVGTLERWEKVASYLGCSVNVVTTMLKQMKSQVSKAVPLSMQGVTGTEKENFGFELYEEKGSSSHVSENNDPNLNMEIPENINCQNSTVVSNGMSRDHCERFWKQDEQRSLEIALQTFPKHIIARWDKIAEFVSTKTKEECIERYKILVKQIRTKKDKGL